jgi:hypothetical protein
MALMSPTSGLFGIAGYPPQGLFGIGSTFNSARSQVSLRQFYWYYRVEKL